MTDIQFKKVTHCRELSGVLDANEAIIDKYEVLSEMVTRFREFMESIEELSKDAKRTTGGITDEKTQVEKAMTVLATQLAGSAYAYAVKQKDVQLQHLFKLADKELSYMRDEDMLTRVGLIRTELEKIIAPLAKYQVTAADVEALGELTGRFAHLIAKRGNARASGKSTTKNIATVLNQLFELLKEEMDLYMRNLARHEPDFTNTYFGVRDKNIYTTPEDDAPDEPQTEQ